MIFNFQIIQNKIFATKGKWKKYTGEYVTEVTCQNCGYVYDVTGEEHEIEEDGSTYEVASSDDRCPLCGSR